MAHNIVILGGSYAGLAVAHGFLNSITRDLNTFEGAPAYRVVLVSPSTHLYWNICAPRALVSPDLVSPEETCIPIEPAFARYPPNSFTFVQGRATDIDTSAKRVRVDLAESSHVEKSAPPHEDSSHRPQSTRSGTIPYHALIIATGSSSVSPLFSLHGTHQKILSELASFHRRVREAKTILIIGGGPTGVETAAQFATHYNRGNPQSRRAPRPNRSHIVDDTNGSHTEKKAPPQPNPAEPTLREGSKCDSAVGTEDSTATMNLSHLYSTPEPKIITLISGHPRLLPELPKNVGKKAEKQLERLGVHILNNVRQISNIKRPNGQFHCMLNNGIALTADILIEATGVDPNTRFLPEELLNETNHVVTDSGTLRVFGRNVGERVYAVGSCADYAAGSTGDVYDAVPVLLTNLRNDLLAHEYRLQTVASTPVATPLDSPVHLTRPHSEDGPSVRYPIARPQPRHYRSSPPQTRRPNMDSKYDQSTSKNPSQPDYLSQEPRGRQRTRAPLPQHFSPPRETRDLQPPSRSPRRTNSIWQLCKRSRKDQTHPLQAVDSHQETSQSHQPLPPFFPSHHLVPLHSVPSTSTATTNTRTSTLSRRGPRALLTPTEAYTKTLALHDAYYVPKPASEVIPTTRYGGVGIIRGHSVPGFVVHLIKGRGWMMGKRKGAVEKGTAIYGPPGKRG